MYRSCMRFKDYTRLLMVLAVVLLAAPPAHAALPKVETEQDNSPCGKDCMKKLVKNLSDNLLTDSGAKGAGLNTSLGAQLRGNQAIAEPVKDEVIKAEDRQEATRLAKDYEIYSDNDIVKEDGAGGIMGSMEDARDAVEAAALALTDGITRQGRAYPTYESWVLARLKHLCGLGMVNETDYPALKGTGCGAAFRLADARKDAKDHPVLWRAAFGGALGMGGNKPKNHDMVLAQLGGGGDDDGMLDSDLTGGGVCGGETAMPKVKMKANGDQPEIDKPSDDDEKAFVAGLENLINAHGWTGGGCSGGEGDINAIVQCWETRQTSAAASAGTKGGAFELMANAKVTEAAAGSDPVLKQLAGAQKKFCEAAGDKGTKAVSSQDCQKGISLRGMERVVNAQWGQPSFVGSRTKTRAYKPEAMTHNANEAPRMAADAANSRCQTHMTALNPMIYRQNIQGGGTAPSKGASLQVPHKTVLGGASLQELFGAAGPSKLSQK